MIIVIIAGGSGTRLWPLSTPSYPKHLLKMNGDKMSLLQSTYNRARKLSSKIYVVSESSHIDHVKSQLPEIDEDKFIAEPARRGTASCILAALNMVAKNGDVDEPIAFMPADHYIRDINGFIKSFKIAGSLSKEQSKLVLMGVEPDYPSTGLGYIEKLDQLSSNAYAYRVKSFKEKPDYNTANRYLKSGDFLWNTGYFVASVNVFLKTMEQFAPNLLNSFNNLKDASDTDYNEVYLGLENISIDYALIEKTDDLLVVQAQFDWMDLGSFGDLHKALGGDEKGNHTHGQVAIEEVSNSMVQNHEDKPVAVIGLDNVVVINSPNGILVARKDLAQKVGEISKKF